MFFQKDPIGFYIETIHKEYTTNDPVFFDLQQFPWAAELEKESSEIIKTLSPLYDDNFDSFIINPEERFQFPPKIWKGYQFMFNGFKFKKHLELFPLIDEKLSNIPNLVSASVSILEPNSRLLPHNGNSNGIMRYHLGLKIPAQMPDIGFIIAGQEVSWQEGKGFMFCNMHVHSVHNLTNKRRYILMLDIVRPEFTSIKKKICAHTIAQILTNITADKVRFLLNIKKENKIDLEKPLLYVPNKGKKDTNKNFIEKNIFPIGEYLFRNFYIVILRTIFLFKKIN